MKLLQKQVFKNKSEQTENIVDSNDVLYINIMRQLLLINRNIYVILAESICDTNE